jgi:hypothetical protein
VLQTVKQSLDVSVPLGGAGAEHWRACGRVLVHAGFLSSFAGRYLVRRTVVGPLLCTV